MIVAKHGSGVMLILPADAVQIKNGRAMIVVDDKEAPKVADKIDRLMAEGRRAK